MPRIAGLPTVYDVPPPHEYWKRPELLRAGDHNATGLFINVGILLTSWEEVEQAVSELFSWFVESKSYAAARAYGYAVAGKKDFLDGAAEAFFERKYVEDQHRKEFATIVKHKAQASIIRNEVAHGRVLGLNVDQANLGYFLVSPAYNSRKTDLPFSKVKEDPFFFIASKYRYTSSQLTFFTQKLVVLRDILLEYTWLLANTYDNEAHKVIKQPPVPYRASEEQGPQITS